MSKEAMKLALKKAFQLGQDYWYQADHESYRQNKKSDETLAKFRQLVDETCEALAKPDFWEGYVPEPDKRQQALDKKAENARELGLDYEPALQECRCNQGQVCHVCDPILPAQQEYERGFIDGMQEQMRRSVDRAVNAMAQRTWVGLTKEDKWEIVQATERDDRGYVMALVEAKLRSKNEDRN